MQKITVSSSVIQYHGYNEVILNMENSPE